MQQVLNEESTGAGNIKVKGLKVTRRRGVTGEGKEMKGKGRKGERKKKWECGQKDERWEVLKRNTLGTGKTGRRGRR